MNQSFMQSDQTEERSPEHNELIRENNELRDRLEEVLDTLRAIRDGEVDALVDSDHIYTLDSAISDTNRFRGQVLAQINEAVVALDNEHRITYINPAAEKQYGSTASAVLGLPLNALYTYRWLHPDDSAEAYRSLDDKDHWRGENLHIRKDGTVMQVESTISRLRDADGRPIGLLAVIRDVTQRARTQAALEESGKQKDHFLATLAHELRNPLSPIMNGLYLMEPMTQDPDLMENTRAMMMRQLQHMVRLVDDLMDLSRISRGKLDLRLEQVDLTSVLAMAMEASRPLIDKNDHHLQVHMAPGSFTVNGDMNRLMQVISNLLNNSAKYTPQGGNIDLRLDRLHDHAVITVKDDGIGIERDALDKVFDMFAQVDSEPKARTGGGLGIGLNIAKKLVLMHNGEIGLRSDGPGRGSEFTVRLPLIKEKRDVTRRTHLSSNSPNTKRRILVVDDNQDAADTLAQILLTNGHSVRVAHDGRSALAIGAEQLPEIIFMDIGMPMMDGCETCQRMRRESWGSGIRIIAVSGWGQDHDRQRSMEAGFDAH
ncbi:MAG: ATP-binding protein, partial [Bacteroidota bacterium]|nr:ATP-binding protein [Bacteroidota bacterium]